MPIIGTPRTFHKKFAFLVEIDQFASAGFQKCSERSVEVANIEYHEGGALTPSKSPGRLKLLTLRSSEVRPRTGICSTGSQRSPTQPPTQVSPNLASNGAVT